MTIWAQEPFSSGGASEFFDAVRRLTASSVSDALAGAVWEAAESRANIGRDVAVKAISAAAILTNSSLPADVSQWRKSIDITLTGELADVALAAVQRAIVATVLESNPPEEIAEVVRALEAVAVPPY